MYGGSATKWKGADNMKKIFYSNITRFFVFGLCSVLVFLAVCVAGQIFSEEDYFEDLTVRSFAESRNFGFICSDYVPSLKEAAQEIKTSGHTDKLKNVGFEGAKYYFKINGGTYTNFSDSISDFRSLDLY